MPGQKKLCVARVFIVGVGGLGSPVVTYLAASGVGCLALSDPDQIEVSNLQRQVMYREHDVGRDKVSAAADVVRGLNSAVNVVVLRERLSGEALREQVRLADVVVDASDNFNTRFAVNRACVAERTPLVSAAVTGVEGQIGVFASGEDGAPCYGCLYDCRSGEGVQGGCFEQGVLGPLVGVIGAMQSVEVLKLIVGFGEPLIGRLLLLDAATMRCRTVDLLKDIECSVCSERALNLVRA